MRLYAGTAQRSAPAYRKMNYSVTMKLATTRPTSVEIMIQRIVFFRYSLTSIFVKSETHALCELVGSQTACTLESRRSATIAATGFMPDAASSATMPLPRPQTFSGPR